MSVSPLCISPCFSACYLLYALRGAGGCAGCWFGWLLRRSSFLPPDLGASPEPSEVLQGLYHSPGTL